VGASDGERSLFVSERDETGGVGTKGGSGAPGEEGLGPGTSRTCPSSAGRRCEEGRGAALDLGHHPQVIGMKCPAPPAPAPGGFASVLPHVRPSWGWRAAELNDTRSLPTTGRRPEVLPGPAEQGVTSTRRPDSSAVEPVRWQSCHAEGRRRRGAFPGDTDRGSRSRAEPGPDAGSWKGVKSAFGRAKVAKKWPSKKSQQQEWVWRRSDNTLLIRDFRGGAPIRS
jgi:hypothetical protein